MTDSPLFIAGAGLAGAAAAVTLARAGHKPLIVEREAGVTEKVCGCFLSVETAAMLRQLGVDIDSLGASHIDRLRLIHRARAVETRLPFPARGLSRKALDSALVENARQAGASVRFGAHLSSFAVAPDGGVTGLLRGNEALHASAVFLATGKHDVRDPVRPVERYPRNVAFKQMFRLTPVQTENLGGAVELYMFHGGYAGLQLVEGGIANLCLVTGHEAFQEAGGEWAKLLAALIADMPQFAARMSGAEPLSARPLAVSRVPYGFVHRPGAADPARLFRLGDQAAVIPSFSGDGMAIALHSGIAAARCYLTGHPASVYHAALEQELRAQFRVASLLHHMAETWWGRVIIVSAGTISPPLLRWVAKATRLRASLS